MTAVGTFNQFQRRRRLDRSPATRRLLYDEVNTSKATQGALFTKCCPAAFRISRKSGLLRTAQTGLWPLHTTLQCSFRIAAIRAWRSIFVG
jgi:hypothetical protein